MEVLAVISVILDWIGKIGSAINAVYQLYKNVDEFNNTPDWFNNPNGLQKQQFDQQMEQIIMSREQILVACANIQDSISQLGQTIFLTAISDKLGDADQAQQALDNWARTGDLLQRDDALNDSAGSLADMLQFSNSGAFPSISLIVPLFEILLIRLVILTQADPKFITSLFARKPIEDSIKLIRSTADSLEAKILERNQVNETSATHNEVRISPEDGIKESIKVVDFSIRYQNVSGTVAYCKSVRFEDIESGDYEEIITLYRAEASAARSTGLAEDLRRAQIETMHNMADTAEKILRDAEIRQVQKIIGRKLTVVERSEFRILRRSADIRQSTMEIADKYFIETELPFHENKAILANGKEILNRELTDDEEQSLSALARTFGAKAVLHTLLNHADSVLIDKPGILPAKTDK